MGRSPFLLVFTFVLALSFAPGQDMGRADRLWRDYLGETVRRGLTLGQGLFDLEPLVVPRWKAVEADLVEARSLEPGCDVELLASWIAAGEGDVTGEVKILKGSWPSPTLGRFSQSFWGAALFKSWGEQEDSPEWTRAWLAWESKVYHPGALVTGLETLDKSDRGAVDQLLSQALTLYPDDRRFLPIASRHPETVTDLPRLLARDKLVSGGWSEPFLRSWLDRTPDSRSILTKAGYLSTQLDSVTSRDYGFWLTSRSKVLPADGEWTWDSDGDGRSESHIVFQKGQPATWTRLSSDGGVWTLGFREGKPVSVKETRGGASWLLVYEAYPLVHHLEYHWGNQILVYRFPPLAQSVPLWPEERFHAGTELLPAALADLWVPLDPRALAEKSSSIETWDRNLLTRTVFLYKGEVWLVTEDSNRDGKTDTWSYFRGGRLASVYRDTGETGEPNLRELYLKGELKQVQAMGTSVTKPEFVLFPTEGIQFWDPKGTGSPLERLFTWAGSDRMTALVFSGKNLPWETMPVWESRP